MRREVEWEAGVGKGEQRDGRVRRAGLGGLVEIIGFAGIEDVC